MVGRNDDDKLILREIGHDEGGIIDSAFDESKLDSTGEHGLDRVTRIPDRDADRQPRVGPAEVDEARRQPVAGDGFACLDLQAPPPQAGDLGQHELRAVDLREDGLRLDEKRRAGLRQFYAATDALEQTRIMASLERGDMRADRRLREMENLRRLCDVLAFGDGDEDAKLVEGHGGLGSIGTARPAPFPSTIADPDAR